MPNSHKETSSKKTGEQRVNDLFETQSDKGELVKRKIDKYAVNLRKQKREDYYKQKRTKPIAEQKDQMEHVASVPK